MVTYSLTDTVGGDLPLPLGGGGAAAVSSALDTEFDVHIGDLAFNLHVTKDLPYRRETAEWRKQQVDQGVEAGEQSISDWWLRSQMSFHAGAGIKYLDTSRQDGQTATHLRYDDSRGMDVWTIGQIKPLPDTSLLRVTTGKTWVFSTTLTSGESYLIYGYAGTVKADRTLAGDTITYTITGMTGTIKSMVIDGTFYYVATSDGHVFKGPIDNSSAGAAIWDFVSSSDVTLGWVKQRLMAGIDHKVYELAGTGPALPTALFTHPSTGWRWTAWSEAPAAVVAAGVNGSQSSMFQFRLDTSAGAPVLTAGTSMAEMPTGETIKSLYLYVGSRLVIGTSSGVRIGQFDQYYGTFSFGPLTTTTVGAVTAICGRGPYVYAGGLVDGETSLVRIDLGLPVDQSPRYAWAPDLRTPSSTVTGAVTATTVAADGRLVFAVQNYGLVKEGTTYGARESWLRTARIRMGTVEAKNFKYGRVRTEQAGGTVSVQVATDQVGAKQVYSVNTDAATERFGLADLPAEWVQLTFTLTSPGIMSSYQVMALPAAPRQRLFSLPVALFDREKNRHGRDVGYAGRAKTLLDALDDLESSGDEIVVQCPVLGLDAQRCTIERIEFTQASNPVGGRSYGLGGYANLIFRTAA